MEAVDGCGSDFGKVLCQGTINVPSKVKILIHQEDIPKINYIKDGFAELMDVTCC